MDDQRIRENIRMKLVSGHLKPYDGMIVRADIGSRQPCRACGLQIDPDYATPYGHAYPGATHWFHLECHGLWEEERTFLEGAVDGSRSGPRALCMVGLPLLLVLPSGPCG
jgi:hypothetical protein